MYIFLEFCAQAKLYAIVALLILLYLVIKSSDMKTADIVFLGLRAAAFIAWSFAINKMCLSGYRYIAWLAAIIPHIIYIFVLINVS